MWYENNDVVERGPLSDRRFTQGKSPHRRAHTRHDSGVSHDEWQPLAQNIQLQLHKKSAEWRNVDTRVAWPKVWDAIFRTDSNEFRPSGLFKMRTLGFFAK